MSEPALRRAASASARGLLAAAAGTAGMDVAQYAAARRAGSDVSFWAWETAHGLRSWDDAPAPAQVAQRLARGVLGRPLPDSAARPTNNVMHWGYGVAWGAVLGLTRARLRTPAVALGAGFGCLVFASSYAVLGAMGIYRPIWEYAPSETGRDLAFHLVYGGTSAVVLNVLADVVGRGDTGPR